LISIFNQTRASRQRSMQQHTQRLKRRLASHAKQSVDN